VFGQAMDVAFCLCRAANHVRRHFVAFHTSDPLIPSPPGGHKQG
jgi:hypothetical protein